MHFLRRYFLLFLLLVAPVTGQGQIDEADWIVQLTEEILEETDLCERCIWVNPTLSFVRFNAAEYVFLRYSCSTTESFARMYTLDGTLESECVSRNGISECGFGGNAFTIYTFADTILQLWNCTSGFECEFALENNIDLKVPITVDDSRCTEGIKILTAADDFTTYSWSGNGQTGNQTTLEITKGGLYTLTVTDEIGCTFDGEIDIPDIAKLEVNIKGPAQFCESTDVELKTANFASYQWSTGDTEETMITNQAGTYQVTVTNDQDCEGSASFLLENFDPLSIEIIADQAKVFEGNPVHVSISTSSNTQPFVVEEWRSNSRIVCDNCPETTYFPVIDNELSVSVIDANGCQNMATFSILVEALPLEVYTPNIFRPNSISENNRFNLYGATNIESIESLSIFDRWGNLVYNNTNISPNQIGEGWDGQTDGTDAPQGIYLFQFKVLFTNGEQKIIGGDVLLMR